MVLLAGQYEAGLLVCGSGQFAGSVLRGGAVEGGPMRVPRHWIFGRRGRVAELDRSGEDVVQAVGGAEGEARRAAFGNPPNIGSREAVSLLLENEDRGRVVDDIG